MSASSVAFSGRAPWVRLFLPFALGYYLSYLLRNANAVMSPVLTRELDLSAADLGLLTSAYFFAFGAFQIPLGILADCADSNVLVKLARQAVRKRLTRVVPGLNGDDH